MDKKYLKNVGDKMTFVLNEKEIVFFRMHPEIKKGIFIRDALDRMIDEIMKESQTEPQIETP